jgi:hypothetical protein
MGIAMAWSDQPWDHVGGHGNDLARKQVEEDSRSARGKNKSDQSVRLSSLLPAYPAVIFVRMLIFLQNPGCTRLKAHSGADALETLRMVSKMDGDGDCEWNESGWSRPTDLSWPVGRARVWTETGIVL